MLRTFLAKWGGVFMDVISEVCSLMWTTSLNDDPRASPTRERAISSLASESIGAKTKGLKMEALTAQGRDPNRIRVVNSRSRVGEEFPENLRRLAKWGQNSTDARMRENVLLALLSPLLAQIVASLSALRGVLTRLSH